MGARVVRAGGWMESFSTASGLLKKPTSIVPSGLAPLKLECEPTVHSALSHSNGMAGSKTDPPYRKLTAGQNPPPRCPPLHQPLHALYWPQKYGGAYGRRRIALLELRQAHRYYHR